MRTIVAGILALSACLWPLAPAEAQEPLIEVPDGALGSMRAERWATLAGQLQQLGLVAEPQPAERYFANP